MDGNATVGNEAGGQVAPAVLAGIFGNLNLESEPDKDKAPSKGPSPIPSSNDVASGSKPAKDKKKKGMLKKILHIKSKSKSDS